MTIWRSLRLTLARSAALIVFLIVAGCATIDPAPPEPVVDVVDPEPVVEPVVEPEPPIVPDLPAEPEPVVPEPPSPAVPQSISPLVAIVVSDRNPAYVAVADALQEYLDHNEVYDLSDQSLSAEDAFATITQTEAKAVVAIGLRAAEAASRHATVPVVVGQVFNIRAKNILSDTVKGVSVLPPLDLQIEEWRRIDPSIKDVGAILGPGHEELIAEAESAMAANGIQFHHALAETDRETLYLFNRLVREIDGFVLFPDNRILSRTVLIEMMGDAARHRVQVAVFNEPLLQLGATFNAMTVPANIAATMTGILDEMINGDIDRIASITPLSDIAIKTNPAIIQKLGLLQDSNRVDHAMADAQ